MQPIRFRHGHQGPRLPAAACHGRGDRATLALGQLASPNGPILREGGYANRIGMLIGEGGLLEQLAEEGILEKLFQPGGTLDQLIALGAGFESIVPKLEALGSAIPGLNQAVSALNVAVEPLSSLAGRLPGGRRKVLPAVSGETICPD